MQRVRRNMRLWWTWVLFLTVVIIGVQCKSTMSFEKPTGDTMDLVKVVKEVRGTIVQIVVPLQNSKPIVGSGFWITQRGYVATCWHVVRDNPTANITVQSATDSLFDLKNNNMSFANWVVYPAKVVAKDEINDLALLKIDGNPFSGPLKRQSKLVTRHYPLTTNRSPLRLTYQRLARR